MASLTKDLFSPALKAIKQGEKRITIGGLWGSSRALFLSSVTREISQPILAISPTPDEARKMFHDVQFFNALMDFSADQVLFSPRETTSADEASPPAELVGERLSVLFRCATTPPRIIVTSIPAMIQRLFPKKTFLERVIFLEVGQDMQKEHLIERLLTGGYHQASIVSQPGEFSPRGGLVDVFIPSDNLPVRIEFFGDEIASVRRFDPETQRSLSPLSTLQILPAKEDASGDNGPATTESLLDYFPPDGLILLDSPLDVGRHARDLLHEMTPWRQLALDPLGLPPQEEGPLYTFPTQTPASLGFGPGPTPFSLTAARLSGLRKEHLIILVCRTPIQQQRLRHLLSENNLPSSLTGESPLPVRLAVGSISSGFLLPHASFILLTEEEIFGKGLRRRPAKSSATAAFATPPQADLSDLTPGDFLVHVHHGIGHYKGLTRLMIQGCETEFLVVEYAGGDKLYVPLDRLDLVQKYRGLEGRSARLDRLGGTSWVRRTQRVQKEIEKIAHELLDLYAEREVIPGFGCSPDTHLSQEFDASFEYEETPDQLTAIDEVKADMERPHPMDRLVCGDVGYGKTEVALRASFKAVSDNKQVAIVAPTTLLVHQHYLTFARRFAPFPVKVEMLSRFRTAREQKRILKDLREGKIDIMIGTHRLLQKDVIFRDLGLFIVDEEQRFGVAQKERLKQMRKALDVLTLTATPIPRTLQMALAGVRSMSVIDTPPPGRLAVRTILSRFDTRIIREAVLREVARGGQVFFVHNRVQSILRMGDYLRKIVPEVQIGIAHGQMRERALEDVMITFLDRKYDILLTTNIIESGLDIPTANTILINRADQFGLADLYQLRGRVGRSGEQAYAYLLVPTDEGLTEDATRRLQALQEFTELGSGFKIAMRDMEIRGAGHLLGHQQSGHIAALGFDLYLQMIEKTVRRLKGERVEEQVEPSLSLRVSAHLPEDYIPDSYQRLAAYKRLSSVATEEEIQSLRREMEDRYGPLPVPARRLLQVMEIKLLARALKVNRIEETDNSVLITFPESSSRVMIGDGGWDTAYREVKTCLERLISSSQG